MPKKQKQTKLIPGEEKAPGFSLGDFMTVAPPKGNKNKNSHTCDNFPELGLLKQNLPSLEGTSPASKTGTSNCWGGKPPSFTESSVSEIIDRRELAVDESMSVENSKSVELPYTIGKTKKGSLPIRVENRNKGKKVTVVFNVSGNLKELLSELKHAAGSGGVVKDDTVEIQGDKAEFVEKFLKNKLKKTC